ncbi:TPA: integrative conjugative element protein, RAQPRD family [Klebsiella oxytoca]|nr:integrative conjugative element protein, RAQPRD family [Klebsiella oxytoca]
MNLIRPVLIIAALLPALASATEQQQLALALRQTELLRETLSRAQTQAAQSGDGRYYFDYTAAGRDITLLEQGIRRYLSPERAQPRLSSAAPDMTFSGHYRREGE